MGPQAPFVSAKGVPLWSKNEVRPLTLAQRQCAASEQLQGVCECARRLGAEAGAVGASRGVKPLLARERERVSPAWVRVFVEERVEVTVVVAPDEGIFGPVEDAAA